jgi:EipB-like
MKNLKRIGWATAGFLMALSSGQAATLAAHRAIYDLSATRLDSGSGYSAIDGRLAYELDGTACDGWAVTYRIANRYVQAEKGTQLLDTQLTTWESGDGLEMNLSQKQYVEGNLDSEEKLKVKREKADQEAKGSMTQPKALDFTVPSQALFPSTHQVHLLDLAKKGTARDSSIVFDGSDGEKTYKAVTFIGKMRMPGTYLPDKNNAEAAPLKGLTSWPMTISYFPANDENVEKPVYQASFNMYENGVSTDLVLDYGTYALKGKLAKLDMLKSDKCEAKTAN